MVSPHYRRAFTIIEILAVLAVIVIISTITFAVFGRVREKGKRTSCQSNMKQIFIAISQYSDDNQGKYPFWCESQPPSPITFQPHPENTGKGWAYAIHPYVKNSQIFQCPSDIDSSHPPSTDPSEGGYTDYAYNLNLSGEEEVKFTQPSNTIVNIEHGYGVMDQAKYMTASWSFSIGVDNIHGGSTRHDLGSNYSFADGHVKWIQDVGNFSEGAQSILTFGNRRCVPPTQDKFSFCFK